MLRNPKRERSWDAILWPGMKSQAQIRLELERSKAARQPLPKRPVRKSPPKRKKSPQSMSSRLGE